MMGNGGSMLFGSVFMWVVWILIFVGLFYLVKASLRSSDDYSQESALEILKKRYARGEISEEQFIEQRKEIEKK
ncbi:MAG: SHOCT domain-containing protein [Gammaproteobacteria bacterium]|nr:SHOCT domain-containing protein [Gammaproteobacteria bacterium]